MNVKIYQIDISRDQMRVCFMSYERSLRYSQRNSIDSSIYDCVFDDDVCCSGNPEEIFRFFNVEIPETYMGRSLSVSDVVEMEGTFFYCDNIGFKEVAFDTDKATSKEDFEKRRQAEIAAAMEKKKSREEAR